MSANTIGSPRRPATVTPLNDMSSQVFIRDREYGLAAMAAADAKHDLKDTFSNIYSTFKDIGCPVIPDGDPKSELTTLDSILHFRTAGASVPTLGANYKSKYLSTDFGGQKEGAFQIFTNSPAYKWKSWFVGKRTADGKDVAWAKSGHAEFRADRGVDVTPTSLFDWLDVQGTKNIAFTVDATCVPLFRVFGDKKEFSGSRKAYNVLTREGVSDSAGKGPQSEYTGQEVQITDLYDYGERGVPAGKFYLHTPKDATENKDDPNDCFFSKFDISVSAISRQSNLNCISMEFTTPGFVKHINTLKGSKEEAHSGTKDAVVAQIQGFLSKLGLAPALQPNISDKNNYFTQIQQKRSGDWLQVLACHDMGRFRLLGLPENCNEIFLITHDQICLAYALAMGINVIFAQYNDPEKSYWLTFFYKDTKPADKSLVLKTYIDDIRNSHRDVEYIAKREVYTAVQKSIYDELVNNLHESMELDPSNIDNLEKVLKDILGRAVDIAYFLQTMPVLENEKASTFYTKYVAPVDSPAIAGMTDADIAKVYTDSGIFKRNKAKIDKHTDLDRTRSIFVGSSDKIRNNFLKDTRTAISNIQIKQRLFSRLFSADATDRRTGVGVFSFLNANLTGAPSSPIGLIREWIVSVHTRGIIAPGTDNDKFWGALKAVALLTLGDDAGAAVEEVLPIDVDIVTNHELLLAVNNAKDVTIAKLSEQVVGITEVVEDATAVEEGTNNRLEQAREYLRSIERQEADSEAAYNKLITEKAPGAAIRYAGRLLGGIKRAKMTAVAELRKLEATVAVVSPVRVTTVDEKETSVFVVSDFQPAVVIAAARARTELVAAAMNVNNLEIQRTLVGGGIPDHNPHTTFFFLLRELGFRFTLDYLDHHEAVHKLAYFILNIYNNIDEALSRGFTERKYLTILEFFVLKSIRDSNDDFHDIITDVTRNYFGFDKISDSYNISNTLPEDIITALSIIPPYEPTQRLEYIPYIDFLMNSVIERCAAMEKQEQQEQQEQQEPVPNRVSPMIQNVYMPEAVAVGGRRTYKRNKKQNKKQKKTQRLTLRRKRSKRV